MATLKHLKCSMPWCNNTVGEHRPGRNKQVCSAHRTHKKHEVDHFKMSQGCANHDNHYGFLCFCQTTILDPQQLDINHIDGNNLNRSPENVEVLGVMCHRLVTKRYEHHLIPNYDNRRAKLASTGLFEFA